MQVRAFLTLNALPHDADVARFTARESLSSLFEVDVRFVCDTPDLDLQASLWTLASLSVLDDEGADPRWFHGVVEEIDYEGARSGRHVYRATLRPRLHGLAYRRRSRIFQDKTAIEVVQRVIRDAGLPAARFDWSRLSADYDPRPYCVQYRERELDFVRRLLEDEGVYWWFEHTADDHTMVFIDNPASHSILAGDPVIPFSRVEHQGRARCTDLVFTQQPTTDTWRSRDWNPTNPDRPREGRHQIEGGGGFARDEYPGRFDDDPNALRMATNRLDAVQAVTEVLRGRTNVRRVMPGRIFSLAGVRQSAHCRDWLVTAVEHRYDDRGLLGDAGATTYELHFEAIPSDTVFRPALVTPKPRAWGKDGAVITGPSAEEIHVDDMGRVKVHFYWDREGAVDDTATCWIRVQQQNNSGAMLLPRVGWEATVGYLDGDPDRPVVLQKVYNRETMSPYEQPSNSTQTALQTATSPGGGSTNEVRLQDGNGGMEFFVHASKDFRLVAGHDLHEAIDVDSNEEVGIDLTCAVGSNQSVHVGGNCAQSVTGSCTSEIVGSRTVSIGANDDWGVKTCQSITVTGNRTETIGSIMNVLANTVTETFNANCTRTVGAALMINSAIAIAESVTGTKSEKIGGVRLEVVRKSYAENIRTLKTLASGAAVIKSGADIQSSAQGALAYTVGGPVVEKCGDAWNLGARAVLINVGMLDFSAGGSSLKCSGGSIKFKGGGLSVKGTVSVKLKGNIDFK